MVPLNRLNLRHNGIATLGLAVALSWAAGARAEPPPSPRSDTQQLLTELETNPKERPLVDGPLRHARDAMGRASEARRHKQNENAAELDRIALTWAQLGRVLLQTVALEAQAVELEQAQNDLETKLKRARALLEETLARRSRAEENLKKLESPAAPAGSATSAEQSH